MEFFDSIESELNVEMTSMTVLKEDIHMKGTYLYEYPCESSTECSPIEVTLHEGTWKIECWGASGGDSYHSDINHVFPGGRGGYSSGLYRIKQAKKLYINIGGQGISNYTTSSRFPGGWNGGGRGYKNLYTGASGGGSTDVRINNNTIENRIIIAGGGGGAGSPNSNYVNGGFGGSGGGLNGLDGGLYSSGSVISSGKGGNQEKGGEPSHNTGGYSEAGDLWKGGDSATGTESSSGGGGGGYYGGSGGAATGGGGGSGYISRTFKNRKLIDGNNTFLSPLGIKEVGHTGNGAVRFTYIVPCFHSRASYHPRYWISFSVLALIYS